MKPKPPRPHLTRRERQVLELLLRSRCDKLICLELGISHSRCRCLVGQLFRKYGVASRLELVLRVLNVDRGLLDAAIKPR